MRNIAKSDLAALLPGKPFVVNHTPYIIKPMSFKQLKGAEAYLLSFIEHCKKKNITLENCTDASKLEALIASIFISIPGILGIVVDLHPADIDELPILKIAELATIAIEVNALSKEVLEKNLLPLIEMLPQAINGASEILSNLSYTMDIPGKQSKTTT